MYEKHCNQHFEINFKINLISEISCGKDGSGSSCAVGEVCVRDSLGKGRCRCDDSCPYIKDPVCGSNGKTYFNECQLNLASCQQKKSITVKHPGKCGKTNNIYANIFAEKYFTLTKMLFWKHLMQEMLNKYGFRI